MKRNEHVIFCECGCGNGVVLKADNEESELSLQLVSDNFYTKQTNVFWEKLKRIWFIIRGKEYRYFDILISKDELKEFKNFVSKL
ncbi:MAG: hypothetical protein IKI94_12830 [Ruminococcus sp.]|nr:hypothetical protein [Ruminococcus sp.]